MFISFHLFSFFFGTRSVFSPSFSSRDDFCAIAKSLPPKSSFSGLANSSAKLALLSFLLENAETYQNTKNVVFIPHESSEIHEIQGFASLFLDPEKYRIFTLPSGQARDEAKVEWVITLAQSKTFSGKNIFLLSETDAVSEGFPLAEHVARHQLILQKEDRMEPLQLFNRLVNMGFEVSPDVSLQKGQYRRSGDVIDIFPVGAEHPFKIEIEFDRVKNIWSFSLRDKKILKSFSRLTIYPVKVEAKGRPFYETFSETDLVITDDIDRFPEIFSKNPLPKYSNSLPFLSETKKNTIRCDSFLYSNSTICLIF